MIPTYRLIDEDPFEIKDKNLKVYPAQLTCSCKIEDLKSLIGTKIYNKEIVAIERFAVEDQSYRTIGLAIKI